MMSAAETPPQQRLIPLDIAAIVICTLCWGTTWYAITLQLGVVDPVVSIIYRFGSAAALLFAWCGLRREKLALNMAQHQAALGIGLFTFCANYALVYWAEERVVSAVVAVFFAAMAFANLISFRIVFGQRAALTAWVAAALGIAGVALLSWGELAHAAFDARALQGLALTILAVVGSTIGNVFARRGELAGAPVGALTAWSMLYGVAALIVLAVATGRLWAFSFAPSYLLSLLHLSLNGSVIAFLLYYGLARRRGYATASYVAALAPPVAMLVSTLFEGKSWGVLALAGIALVLSGQWLLLKARRA